MVTRKTTNVKPTKKSEPQVTRQRRTFTRALGKDEEARKQVRDQVRMEYIEGVRQSDGTIVFQNLLDLAEKYDLNYGTLKNRASIERWTDKRNAHQLAVNAELQKKRQQELAKEAHQFDGRMLDGAKLGANLVTQRLAEIAQEQNRSKARQERVQQILDAGGAVDKKDTYSAIYYKELQGLADSLETFQRIGMRAMGTDVNRVEVTGANGDPVQHVVSVREELHRDDPERLAATLQALMEAGILDQSNPAIDNVVDVTIIEDDEDGDDAG